MSLSLVSCSFLETQNNNHEEVFNWIEKYAGEYCATPPTENSVVEVSVKISKDAGFFDLLEKIGIGVDAEVKASFKKTNGVLQQHLAAAMISANHCRTEVLGVVARLMGPIYVKGNEIEVLAKRKYLIDMIKPPLLRMYRGDADDYLIYSIPKIPGGLTCNEFVGMLDKPYKADRMTVIEVAAPYIQKPFSPTCYGQNVGNDLSWRYIEV